MAAMMRVIEIRLLMSAGLKGRKKSGVLLLWSCQRCGSGGAMLSRVLPESVRMGIIPGMSNAIVVLYI